MAGEQSYKGKLAIITGGASGLGLALANHLAAQGATPVLLDIHHADTPYHLEVCDTTDAASLAETVAKIEATHGPIDLAIANAAIDLTGEAHTFDAHDWRAIINTNLIGATNLVAAIYPEMVTRSPGQILLISSGAGLIGFPLGAPYTASKAGLIGLGKALRAEAARYGVMVNVACPPILETPLLTTGKAKPGINRAAFIASLSKKPMPADKTAQFILRGAARNTPEIVFPFQLRLGNRLAALFPGFGNLIRAGILKKFDKHGRS